MPLFLQKCRLESLRSDSSALDRPDQEVHSCCILEAHLAATHQALEAILALAEEMTQEVETAYHWEESRQVGERACRSVVSREEEGRSVGMEGTAYRDHLVMEESCQALEAVRPASQMAQAYRAIL